MKLTGMQKIIVAAVVIGVVALAVFALLILPQFTALSELDAKQSAATVALTETQTKLAMLQESKGKASETQAQLVRLSNQLPDNPELPSLIMELQDICNDSGLRFASITPARPVYRGGTGAAPADLNYTDLKVTISVEGNWSDTIDFLRRVNKLIRAARVTNISITVRTESVPGDPVPDPPRPYHPTLTTNVEMKVFVIGKNGTMAEPAAAATTAPAPAPAP